MSAESDDGTMHRYNIYTTTNTMTKTKYKDKYSDSDKDLAQFPLLHILVYSETQWPKQLLQNPEMMRLKMMEVEV